MSEIIFVVDKQFDVRHYAKQSLEAAGYAVRAFSTADILSHTEAIGPSLILVSMALPDACGLKLCQQVRANSALAKTAVVFLLDSAAEADRILALESGGEDCIVKPLSRDELLSTVRTVLRRFVPSSPLSVASIPDLVIDPWAMKLYVRGVEVLITTLEFGLIEYLAHHRGQVFKRNVLLDAIWGEMRFVTPRSVDACIRRIREKIETDHTKPSLLKTVRGVGYRLDATAAWEPAPRQSCDCIVCRTVGGAETLYARHLLRKQLDARTHRNSVGRTLASPNTDGLVDKIP